MTIVFLLTIFVGFPGLLVWAYWADHRNHKKERENKQLESDKWLEEQKSLPRYRVYVKPKIGFPLTSEAFEPTSEVRYWGLIGWQIERETSKGLAVNRIEASINSGRFHDRETSKFYPMCEIEYMQAQEIK